MDNKYKIIPKYAVHPKRDPQTDQMICLAGQIAILYGLQFGTYVTWDDTPPDRTRGLRFDDFTHLYFDPTGEYKLPPPPKNHSKNIQKLIKKYK